MTFRRQDDMIRIPHRRLTAPFAVAVAALGLAACGGSDDNGSNAQPLACADLATVTVPAASIGLPTQGATVTSATVVAAAGSGATAVPEYCRVQGQIAAASASAPAIRFQVNLPTAWNTKAVMFGGGGYNGTVATGTGNVPAGPTDKASPLGRGYATFGSDSGHVAGAAGSRDGSFGLNDEALKNFGGDALKKTRDTAMAIIRARYGSAPTRTYFAGGSTGGREALIAVGNWPQDFDGAIVLYPAWNATALNLHLGRTTQALAQPSAYPSREQRKVLFDAAMQACDNLDGVVDGLISNQFACEARFDPATATLNGQPIQCAAGVNNASCLTPQMIAAIRVFERPTQLSYRLPSGETGHPGYATWGTDLGITTQGFNATQLALQPTVLTLTWGVRQPANPMPSAVVATDTPPYGATFWDEWVKYFVTRNPSANPLTLDPVVPGASLQRILDLNTIQDANRTDLSEFRARGGKILMAHGIHDGLVPHRGSQQLMQRWRTAMGTAAVDSFVRYYEIPGYNHAVSTQFNAAWDSLTALEAWVEQGTAPTNQVVADTAAVPGRTRPLCEYPAFPRYKGTGDVNAAASFACANQ
jgi:hypothetical protein